MQDGGLNIASYNQLSKQEKKCEELILVNENMKTINKKVLASFIQLLA